MKKPAISMTSRLNGARMSDIMLLQVVRFPSLITVNVPRSWKLPDTPPLGRSLFVTIIELKQ